MEQILIGITIWLWLTGGLVSGSAVLMQTQMKKMKYKHPGKMFLFILLTWPIVATLSFFLTKNKN